MELSKKKIKSERAIPESKIREAVKTLGILRSNIPPQIVEELAKELLQKLEIEE